MNTLENKLKTVGFWLRLGIINHCVAIAAIAMGCVYSGFTCKGEPMKDALSLYAFTLLTPQIALEVILIVALFLTANSFLDLRKNLLPLSLFIGTLSVLILFSY